MLLIKLIKNQYLFKMEIRTGLCFLLLQGLLSAVSAVQLIEDISGDESINYGDQVAVVDNKPVNNIYYQMKRLPQPAPMQEVVYERRRPQITVQRAPPMVIRPVQAAPEPHEISLRRRGNFPECSLPPDAGDCTGEFIRIFFDDRKMSCEVFYYSGCGGNANRFTSIKACYDICSPHTATVKGPEVLSGKRYVIMPKPGAPPPPPPPPQIVMPSSHPPYPHYDQEVQDPSKVYYHPDSYSEKVPINVQQGQQPQEQQPQIMAPSKVSVIRQVGGGNGMMGMGMGNGMMGGMGMPGMVMGDTMFPNQMGMGLPANF